MFASVGRPVRVAVIIPAVVIDVGIYKCGAVIYAFVDRRCPGYRFQCGTRLIRELCTVVVVVSDIQCVRVKTRVLSPPENFSGIDFHHSTPDAFCLELLLRHHKAFFQCLLDFLVQCCIDIVSVFCALRFFFHSGKNIAVFICLINAVSVIPPQICIEIKLCAHFPDR